MPRRVPLWAEAWSRLSTSPESGYTETATNYPLPIL